MVPHTDHPRQPRLDPDRDFSFFPARWDLSSLPEPGKPAEGQAPVQDQSGETAQMDETSAKFFADLQLDPYLDDDSEPSKRDCSIY